MVVVIDNAVVEENVVVSEVLGAGVHHRSVRVVMSDEVMSSLVFEGVVIVVNGGVVVSGIGVAVVLMSHFLKKRNLAPEISDSIGS